MTYSSAPVGQPAAPVGPGEHQKPVAGVLVEPAVTDVVEHVKLAEHHGAAQVLQ
jgi:hypothetical protein